VADFAPWIELVLWDPVVTMIIAQD